MELKLFEESIQSNCYRDSIPSDMNEIVGNYIMVEDENSPKYLTTLEFTMSIHICTTVCLQMGAKYSALQLGFDLRTYSIRQTL